MPLLSNNLTPRPVEHSNPFATCTGTVCMTDFAHRAHYLYRSMMLWWMGKGTTTVNVEKDQQGDLELLIHSSLVAGNIDFST